MPIARFQLPDGRVARFEVPEGTTPEQAQSMMEAHFSQQPHPQVAATQTLPVQSIQTQEGQPSPTTMQEVQASVPGRILQGMRDPIDEAAALLPKGLQAITSLGGNYPNAVSNFFGSEASRVQDINKQNEAQYQAAKQATGETGLDVSRFAGNVLSPANLAAALRAGKAATIAGKALQGAKVGAIGGALANEDVNSPDYWKNKAIDIAGGGVIGGVIPSVVGGLARVINPEVKQKVADLLRQGITPTPGQILGGTAQKIEEQLQSVPIIGHAIASAKSGSLEEFNKAVLNRAVAPIGETVDKTGREGVLQVKQKLSDAYNNLLPKIGFTPDAQYQSEMAQLQQMASGLGNKEADKFNSIMSDVMSKASPNGSMTGETFKIVESKLGGEAKKFSGSTDAYQKELGDALTQALTIMRNTLPRVNPQYADQLQKINEGYANYARIRAAASSTAAGAREGLFTPAQLAAAVRQADKSAGKGASATGQALMQDLAEQGTNVLGSKVPDSGTAGRLMTAGAGAALATNPWLVPVVAAGMTPYIGAGRTIAAKALTQRPEQAARLAALLRQSAPALSGGIPMAALGNQP